MALTLITGSAGSGKTVALHSALREHVARGGTAALLLPAEPDVSRDTAHLATVCHVGLSINTLDGFLEGLWSKHGDGRRPVGDLERGLLLEETVNRIALTDGLATAGVVGILDALVRRVAEVPEAHDRLLAAYGDADAGDPPHTIALSLAGAYFRELRERGLVERAEALHLIAQKAAGLPLPGLVTIGRFTDFTSAQERFIREAADVCDLRVTLVHDPEVPATAGAAQLVSRLGSFAQTTVHPEEDGPARVGEMHALRRAFGRRGPVRPGGAILISEGVGVEGEADRIVAELQAARREGIEYPEMAVAFRRPDRHVLSVVRSCVEAQIPASVDLRVPFADSGLGAALITLLEYQNLPGEARRVLAVLRSPYCPGDSDALDEVDARLRRSADKEGVRLGSALRAADRDAATFLDRVERASRRLRRAGDATGWYRLVSEMLASAQAGRGESDIPRMLDSAAQRTFVRALTVLVDGGTIQLTPQALAGVLRTAALTTTGAEDGDAVRIMSADRLRGLSFRMVVLGGLTAEEFPGGPREDALKSPGVVKALAGLGIDAVTPDVLAEERLLFYQAAACATDRLVLSYASADEEGRELPRSVFVEEVLDLYRDETGGIPHGGPPVRALGVDGVACGPMAPQSERRILRAIVQAGDEAPSGAVGRIEHARRRARPTGTAPLDPSVTASLVERNVFSASDIEAYLQCPYMWFIGKAIRPDRIDATVDASTAGQYGHALLSAFYQSLWVSGRPRVTPETLAEAAGTFEAVVEAIGPGRPTAGPAEQALMRRSEQQAWRFIESDATFLRGLAPAYAEWSFGMSDDDEPVDLGGFALRGRIDRIDANEDGFVVIDYKFRGLDASWGHVKFGERGRVQLPLYAAVVRDRLGARPFGGLYRGVRGKPRGFIVDGMGGPEFVAGDTLDAEGIEALIQRSIELARGAVDGMRAGRIPAEPLGGRCPDYCKASGICPRLGGGEPDA